MEQHLKRLFNLSQMPSQVRIPGAIPQLIEAQREQQHPQPFSPQSPSQHSQPAPPPPPMGITSPQTLSNLATGQPGPVPLIPPSPSGSNQSWDPMAAFYAANLAQSPFSSTPAAVSQQQQQHGVMSPTAPISPWTMAPQHSSTGLDLSAMTAASAPPPPMAGSSSGLGNTNVGVGAGQDVHSILMGYYKHLYRFLPVFLPPEYIHIMANRLSSDSPFILSLQAILPLLSLGEEQQGGGEPEASTSAGTQGFSFSSSQQRKEQLIQMSAFYERRASEAIEAVLERAEGHMANGKTDSVTSQGSTLGVIQALAVLCVYHYGSGRALKARLKADQALGLCMAKGLHRLKRPAEQGNGGSGSGESSASGAASKSSFVAPDNDPFGSQSLFMDMPETVLYEMQKRIWWTCWSSSLWCAYNTAIVPTIRADDPRVRTEVPATSDTQAWSANVKSLQLLLLIQERVLALSNGKDLDSGSSGSGSGHQEPSGGGGGGSGQHARDESKSSTYAGSSMGGDASTPSAADAAFHSLPSNATRQDILDSMMDIDRNLQEQIRLIESDEDAFRKLCQEPEGIAAASAVDQDDSPEALSRKLEKQLEAYLRRSAAIQVYTSSLTLHLGQAFQGATLFERKLCFLNTIGENDASAACQVPMPDSFTSIFGAQGGSGAGGGGAGGSGQSNASDAGGDARAAAAVAITNAPTATTQDLFARGPFLPRESLDRCVHASKRLLEIARHRGGGGSARVDAGDGSSSGGLSEPNPFNACSFVLISFTLLMQALAVSSGSQDLSASEGEEREASNDDEGQKDGGGGSNDFSFEVSGGADGDGDFDMDDFLDGSGGGDDLDEGPPSFSTERRPSLSHQSRSHSSADVDAFSRGVLQSAQGAAALGGGSAVASGSGTPLQHQSHQPSGLSQQQQQQDGGGADGGSGGAAAAAGPESIDWASLLARQSQQQQQQSQQQDVPAGAAPLDITNDQRRRRREKLREIWSRVSEAHRTLVGLSRYWKMVEPMADEVSLCLETSKMLLMQ